MRRSLLLYLLIISVLVNLFTYAYLSKTVDFERNRYEKRTKSLKDSLDTAVQAGADAAYFTLANNQNAQEYFESGKTPMAYEKLIPIVREKLLDYNNNPKGNPYTGQDMITGKPFVINKVQIVNHRWIIADFSDSEYWGEVFLKYFVNDDQTVSFEVVESLIHVK